MTNLSAKFDGLLLDLDGVVYVGPDSVPNAAESIRQVRSSGVSCGFVTNNASRSAEAVAEHLTSIGVPAVAHDVITSPQAAVTVLGEHVAPGSRVLVIGGSGISEALLARGYVPVRSLSDDPAAVMQGFSPDLGWRDLAEATYAVRAGLPWIATNPDLTFPTPQGAAPGNGSLVRVVADAAGRKPDAIAGKPEPPLLQEAVARIAARHPLMIGDRLDTDIEAGTRIGIPSLLVLTGVTTVASLLAACPAERPTYIGVDLRVLLEPYPDVIIERDPGWAASCAGARVEVVAGELVATSPQVDTDVLRAAAALAWALADAGEPCRMGNLTLRLSEWVTRMRSEK